MTAVNASETAIVIAALEEIFPAQTFLLDTLASEVVLSETKQISMDLLQGTREVSPLVHPRNPAKIEERSTIEEKVITPGYLKPGRKITGEDLDKRLAGEVANMPMPRTERLRRIRTRDAAEMRDGNTRWQEWVLAQQLTTGAVSVIGDGMDLVFTLPLLADHNVAAGALFGGAWDGATANGLIDLRQSQFKIHRDSGLPGNVAIFGSRAWEDFLTQEEVRKLVDTRRIDPMGQLAFGNDGLIVNDHGGAGGLRYWTYDEHFRNSAGTLVPLIPQDVCVVASTQMRVVRAFGRISSVRQTVATPEWVHEWFEENPETHFISLEAAPLPFIQQVNGYVILNTRV